MSDKLKEAFAWSEWKEKCQIDKCSKENKDLLNEYGDSVLKSKVARFSKGAFKSVDFNRGMAFALFEMHAINKEYGSKNNELKGKSYKDGLFQMCGIAMEKNISLLRTYFYLYLRDSLRAYYYNEIEGEDLLSLNTPVAGSEDGDDLEFQDLLQSEVIVEDEVEKDEIFKLASEYSLKIFDVMKFNHKAIMLSVALGLPHTRSKALQKVTGMAKSTIADNYINITKNKRYIDVVKKDFPGENDEIIKELYALSVYLICRELIIPWGNSEIKCQPLFIESEGQLVEGDGNE